MPQILPVPWINGTHPYNGDWVTFDESRAVQAHEQRLCAVCGQPLERIALLGRSGDRSTTGFGCHPRCMQLAFTACPHFTDPAGPARAKPAVAWRVDGPQLGGLPIEGHPTSYERFQRVVAELPELSARDVQSLASIDPWGTGRPDTMDAEDTLADG